MRTLPPLIRWNRSAAVLLSGFFLTVGLIVYVWWPLAEELLRYIDWHGPWWLYMDWLLIGLFLFMSLTIIARADLRRDGLILFVATIGGLVIEAWGTQTNLWFYYTSERPPLWIVPAWPIATLSIDRITRLLAWLSSSLSLRRSEATEAISSFRSPAPLSLRRSEATLESTSLRASAASDRGASWKEEISSSMSLRRSEAFFEVEARRAEIPRSGAISPFPSRSPSLTSKQPHRPTWQLAYWIVFLAFLIIMVTFVMPTFNTTATILAFALCVVLIATPPDHRLSLLVFSAGAALGYFLELWGTTRECWTYYTYQTPPLFAVLAHGMAAVAFWRTGLWLTALARQVALLFRRVAPEGEEA